MIIVNYKSKRKLKKAIGKLLNYSDDLNLMPGVIQNNDPFFVTNYGGTFKASVTLVDGIIKEVR